MADKRLLDGESIFLLMDSHGLPLEIICLELRREGLAFNVLEFVESALRSKNFTYSKIKTRLLGAMLPEYRGAFALELDETAAKRNWC